MQNKYNKYPAIPNTNFIDFFKKYNQKEQFSILEIGCNAGQNLKALYEFYPNTKFYGVDILEDAIEQARITLPSAHFYIADIEEDPYLFSQENLEFDYILFPDVLEHFYHPEKVLKALKHCLKDDGCIFANIPNLMHWSIISDIIIYGNFSYTSVGLLDYDHKHLFTYNEIVKLFEQNGFVINEISSIITSTIPQELERLFKNLISISKNVEMYQYETFTYLVRAFKS